MYETSTKRDAAVTHTAGRRNYNEDRVCITTNVLGTDLYAVFDGHNGHEAATYCRDHLKETFESSKGNMVDTFANLHKSASEVTKAGCTATVVAVRTDAIEVANVGDSPAFVIDKQGNIKKVTHDHKLTDPAEEEMIIKNGGSVINLFGTKRVNGLIMITRSIGDKSLHPPMTSEPSVTSVPLTDIAYVCLMSDGVTDALSFVESGRMPCRLTRSEQRIKEIVMSDRSLVVKTQLLRNEAYSAGSRDNISAVIIEF